MLNEGVFERIMVIYLRIWDDFLMSLSRKGDRYAVFMVGGC